MDIERRTREAEKAVRESLWEWAHALSATPPSSERDKTLKDIQCELINLSASAQSFRELITTQTMDETRKDTHEKLVAIATMRAKTL